MKKIKTPLTKKERTGLKCGEEVLLTGTVYTARDAAHKKLVEIMQNRKNLPLDLKNAVIYYTGPTPGFGSCGPTTSSRMDKFTPHVLKKGISAMIGKGRRSPEVRRLIKKYKAVYFLAAGGAGAYLAKRIKRVKAVAFKDLGPEAIYKVEIKDFPLIVGIDSKGKDIYR